MTDETTQMTTAAVAEPTRNGLRRLLILAAALFSVAISYGQIALGWGQSPAEFAADGDSTLRVAGYAFSIWGPIYLWLVAHAAFGLFARAEAGDWAATRWPLIVSLGLGASWISVAQVNPALATLLIWVMLGGALMALLRAPLRDRWLLAGPLGLYAGWLTAASFVSIGLLGAGYGVAFGETAWAWVALLAALATVLAVQSRVPQAPEYGLAAAWAFVAVAVANWGEDAGLVGAALLAAALAGGFALLRLRATTPA